MSYLLWLPTIPNGTKHHPWVAQILGFHPSFGLDRKFLAPVDKRRGERCYLLEDGPLFQVGPLGGEDARYFCVIETGELVRLSTEAAMKRVEALVEAHRREYEATEAYYAARDAEREQEREEARRRAVEERARLEVEREGREAEVDQRIARLNAEGGIVPSEN